jgi:S1-C subfamily serine protease
MRKKPDPSVPPFAVQLKRTVVNVELQCKEGNSLVSEAGTGFLVGYNDPRLPKGRFFEYLVTNRHVAECWDGHNQPRQIQALKIRVNAKDGTSRRLDANPAAWRVPTDDSVDLAVMSVLLPEDLLIAAIPTDGFATRDFMSSNRIAEGSPILLSGYFYQFSGERRFQSIVRQGILSMVPDEPMTTTTGKPGTVYLCDAHIFGGNSGSPVAVSADWLGVDGYRLLGVVSGYYYEDQDFNLEIATTIKGTARANSGVAMIVPVDFLKALLDEPDLKNVREAYFSHPAGIGKP